MPMGVAPEDQGQMVEVSYGWIDGRLYCCSLDRSDGTEQWYVATKRAMDRVPETWCIANGPPPVCEREWRPCPRPRDDEE